MQKFRAFWRRILLPRPRILLLFVFPAVIFLLPLSCFEHPAPRAISFLLALYVLLSLSLRLPLLYRLGRESLLRLHAGKSRAEWWARAALFGGLFLNLIYALFRVASGLLTHSLWFCAEAVYYMVLSAIRFALVEEDRRISAERNRLERRVHAWKSYRKGGLLLLLLSLSAAGIVSLAIRESHTHSYPDLVVAATVLFTLWRLGSALYHLLRFRRRRQPIPLLSKAISLSAALVSFFGLQGTLLARFGQGVSNHALWNGLTGGFICISLSVMALLIIFKGKQMLQHYQKKQDAADR